MNSIWFVKLRGNGNKFHAIATKTQFVAIAWKCCPHVKFHAIATFLAKWFCFRNKQKNSNRFEFFICFCNKFYMLQMRLMKKPRVPAPWSGTFATQFFLTNEILLHNYTNNRHISLSSLSSRVLQTLAYFLYKFCFVSWNPCDTGTNFCAIETFVAIAWKFVFLSP